MAARRPRSAPPWRIHPQFRYVLQGYLKTEGLKHDAAYLSLELSDSQHEPLHSFSSTALRDVPTWQPIRLGPLTSPSPEARFATIGLHLRPGEQADLRGAAFFAGVSLVRVPQMTLEVNSPLHIFTSTTGVEITCRVSGIADPDRTLSLTLLDVADQPADTWQTRLEAQPQLPWPAAAAGESGQPPHPPNPATTGPDPAKQQAYAGSVSWKPAIGGSGFYRVRATMHGSGRSTYEQNTTLVVVDPAQQRNQGEFGWSLPAGDQPLAVQPLVGLLTQVGIHWVKFPVWFSDKDPQRADLLAWFADRLSSDNLELVGVLDQPPPNERRRFGEEDHLPAAAIFAQPEVWQPVLDPVMTRLSLKVQWWQLGRDGDASYVGYPQLPAKVGEVKSHLQRFGQSINLGIGWRWLNEVPESDTAPWDFLSLAETPPLTSDELKAHLAASHHGQAQRWVVLQPLARAHYDRQVRVEDLVLRMLAAKIGGAQRVFLSDPFHSQHGLMNADGTPGELLLPWRTTALMISGTQAIGSIQLPGGSWNEILTRDDQVIMVARNEQPAEETLYLGPDVRQVDVWGRQSAPRIDNGRQVISVGPLPTFVTGLHPSIARWSIAFQADQQQLSSVVGRPQNLSYRLTNTFPQGVSGTIMFHAPPSWGAPPMPVRFKMASGEELSQSLPVALRADAGSGQHQLRIDFDVAADQRYQFSVYRTVAVGLADVSIELTAHINAAGELIVQQRLVNQSEQFVSFNCFLFAPQRRRLRQQVFDLAQGTDKRTYVLPRGDELVGETVWLRAEEIGGDRVLNYQLQVEK